MAPDLFFILTCEHASNAVPPEYRALFKGEESLLQSHSGFDIGAAELARALSRHLDAPLFEGEATRLLVDLNRAESNRKGLFSRFTSGLDETEKEKLVAIHYRPFRKAAEDMIAGALSEGRTVVHLSVHSFTPVFNGKVRNADVGLLYDPSRAHDRRFAQDLKAVLATQLPGLRVRMNYPYPGRTDGFAPFLRRRFKALPYHGLEFEMNQSIAEGNEHRWKEIKTGVGAALTEVLCGLPQRSSADLLREDD